MPTTKIVFHDAYLTDYPTASVEKPERVEVIHRELSAHSYSFVTARPADERDLLLVHYPNLVQSEKRDRDRYDVALLAAGGSILAAEIAMDGVPAFGLVRPPGHHASPGTNWGFCFFNNMALAIQRLILKKRIERAVILDIDLHFGDGTDNYFMGRSDVSVVNVQSSNRLEFLAHCQDGLTRAAPYDIIGVSAGFDRYIKDWGSTLLTEDFKAIGQMVKEFSQQNCSGRRFALLEGGYYLPDLGLNARNLIEGME
ncbi:MAG: histone deacetylase family protein [Deltaproteobacteria bacterium]|nr:histone deacetylase family protein [Candidatus Zymogenaceae bacterium]